MIEIGGDKYIISFDYNILSNDICYGINLMRLKVIGD